MEELALRYNTPEVCSTKVVVFYCCSGHTASFTCATYVHKKRRAIFRITPACNEHLARLNNRIQGRQHRGRFSYLY